MHENLVRNFEGESNSGKNEAFPVSAVLVDFGTEPKKAHLAMALHLEENGMQSTMQTPSGAEYVPNLNLER